MNKTISLTAIAMFAVIMGLSSFAPAMADPNNPTSEATSGVCHFDNTDTQMWEVLWTHSNGQQNAHIRVHGDEVVNNSEEAYWCQYNQDGTVIDPYVM